MNELNFSRVFCLLRAIASCRWIRAKKGAQFSALREIGSMRERALWARNLRRPVNVNFRLAYASSSRTPAALYPGQ